MKSKIWKFWGIMFLVFMMPDAADAQTVGVTANALGWAALNHSGPGACLKGRNEKDSASFMYCGRFSAQYFQRQE